MTKLLAFLLMLISSSTGQVSAATITSATSGNWNVTGTWVGGVIPGVNDTAVVANTHTVTLSESTTVGTSPADQTTMVVTVNSTGKLIINTDVVLTIRGNMLVNSSSTTVPGLEMGPGSKIVMDASVSGQAYTVKGGDKAILYARGTAGNPAYIESREGYTNGIITPYLANKGPYFDSDYLHFKRLGSSSVTGFTAFANSASYNTKLSIKHAIWDSCGAVYTGVKAGDSVAIIEDSKIINPLNSTLAMQVYGFTPTTGSFNFRRNVVDGGPISFYPATGVIGQGNYFGSGMSTGLYTGGGDRSFLDFGNNFIRSPTSTMNFAGGSSGDYWLRDTSAPNVGVINWFVDVNRTVTGSVFDYTFSSNVSDLVIPQVVNAGATHTFTRNIMLPGSSGGSPGKLVSMLFAGCSMAIDGNTIITEGDVEQGIGVGEGDVGAAGQITSFRNNLFWTPSTKTPGYKMQRQQSVKQDFVYAANANYNWGWNIATGSEGSGYQTWTSYRTPGLFSSGTPDVNGGNGDPEFTDVTRNLATYDTAGLGNAAGTTWANATAYSVGDVRSASDAGFYGGAVINYRCIAAHTSASGDTTNGQPGIATNWRTNWEFQGLYRLREDVTRIAGLIAWVKGGFAPNNPSLANGYGGAYIGAIEITYPASSGSGAGMLMGF